MSLTAGPQKRPRTEIAASILESSPSADPGHVGPLADAVKSPFLVPGAGRTGGRQVHDKVDIGRVVVISVLLRDEARVVGCMGHWCRLYPVERRDDQVEPNVNVNVVHELAFRFAL